MEEKKVSLLNEFEKMNPFRKKEKNEPKEEKIKDERIISINNEIFSNMYCILFLILFISEITCDTLMININGRIISILIGLVSYIGLILLCKKNAIEGNKITLVLFISGNIGFPSAILNSFSNYLSKKIDSAPLILFGGQIVLIILLYQIVNTVYKKNKQ